jgi:hypothetical protein
MVNSLIKHSVIEEFTKPDFNREKEGGLVIKNLLVAETNPVRTEMLVYIYQFLISPEEHIIDHVSPFLFFVG